MTKALTNTVQIPNWVLAIVASAFIGVFATSWTKIENIQKDLTVEQTSRCYIEKALVRIEKKVDNINLRLDKLED